FMIPCDSNDISKEYGILLNELKVYNPELLDKERLLAITKCDMLDEEMINQMKANLPQGIKTVFISSVSGKNIDKLKDLIWETLNKDNG
ncbi:MAG: GTPase ObgE, partial [Bacteroidales bacterium]|nr:GTPase ObgE [Bacteroidales bacterium]